MKTVKAAGGIVVNNGRVAIVSQLNHMQGLPKGRIQPGENALEAAIREIGEETGIPREELTLVKLLGTYERFKKKDLPSESYMREITVFLFRTTYEDLNPQDDYNPMAEWVKIDTVDSLMSYPEDREFFAQHMEEY